MVIQTSNIAMSSSYQRTAYNAETAAYTNVEEDKDTFAKAVNEQVKKSAATVETQTNSLHAMQGQEVKITRISTEAQEPVGSASEVVLSEETVEYKSLESLLSLLGNQIKSAQMTANELFAKLMEQYRTKLEHMLATMGERQGMTTAGPFLTSPTEEMWYKEWKVTDLHMESEHNTFFSEGTVTTADGRNLSFDLSLTMSSSFVQYSNVEIDYKRVAMVDPLVISLGEDAVSVSDQKFLFDIDADGTQDNISLLTEMCGFLAFDRNEDGTINDGSELFGAKTGDGFAELSVFDLDQNGWIDENDEIFNRLRIWRKDDAGNDKLVALGIAGIGAIYLGNISSKFTLRQEGSNEANAEIKNTGIYLTETGQAHAISHVDMAAT